MSVIIRLQRLPLSANASAIRQFFFGLKIPEGSVHIVGGDDGDAFIGFATDEDARQAMRLDGQPLHNSRVKLLLSSRVEMEAVIAKARAGDLRRQASSSSSARDQPSPARPTDLQRSPSPKRPPPAVSGFSSFPSSSYKNQYQQQTRERPDISAPDSYYNRPGQSGGGGRLMPQPANLPAFGGGGRPLEVSRPLDISGNRPPHLSDNNGSSSRGSGDSWAQRPAPRNDSWVTTPTFGRHTNSHNNNYDSAMSNRPLEGGQQRGQWPPAPSLNQPMEQQGGYGRPQQSNKEEQRNGETFFNHHRPMEDAGRFFGAGARSSDDSQRNAFTGPPHRGLADTMGSQQNSAYGRQPDMGVRDGRSSGAESPPPPAVRRPARPSLLPAPPLQQQIPIGVDDFRQQPPAGNANEYHQLGVGDQRPFDQIIRDQSMPIQSNSAQGIFSRSAAGGGLPGFGPPTAIAPPPQHQPQQHMSAPRCVELSRLPAELLRPAAIEQFLRPAVPLTLSSVKVVFDQHGFPLHTLVRFDNPDDADRTLARDGEQGIRIRPCTLPDFDRAVDGTAKISPGLIPQPFLPLLPKSPSSSSSSTNFSGPPPLANFSGPPSLVGGGAAGNASKERYCLTFSNMAYRADDRDIARFLGNVIVPTKITRLYYEDAGKASDRWLVEFDNMSQAEQAAELRGEIRGRPVRVVRTPNDQADRMLAVPDRYGQKKIEEFNAKTGGSEPNERMGTSLIGRQQKAPPLLDPRQSLRSGEEPHAQDSDGRRHVPSRSGHQRSRSRSPRDRRSSSRSSYDAPSSHSSRRDQQSHERREDVIDHRQAPPVYRQEAPLPSPSGPSCCVKLTNLPMHAMERDVAGFLDSRLAYHGAVHMTKDGNAYVELATEMDAVRALRQHRAYLGANCVNVLPVSKEELNAAVRGAIQPPIMTASPAKGGQLSTMGNMNQRQQQQPLMSSPESSKDVDPAVVASIGRPGTVIAVHGLPVTITLDDLVAFFERYQLLEDSVRMHFDDTGCPTGDCLLAMATPGDAGKAVQELNGRRLNGSLVTMYVVRSG